MYTKDNPPEWATHVYYFNNATMFFNKENFLWMDANEMNQYGGNWGEDDNSYEEYTERVERHFKVKQVLLNFALENE